MTIYLVNLLLIGSVMFLSTRYHETTHGKGIYLTKRWGLVVVTILLGGVASIRWDVGTDFFSYTSIFQLVHKLSFSEAIRWTGEPLFNVMAWLVMAITENVQVVFAMCSFATVGMIVSALSRYSAYVPLSIYLYVTSMSYYSAFNGVRQWLAAAIVFYSYRYLFSNRTRFFALVLLASMIHNSAFIMIPLYYFVRKPFFRRANLYVTLVFIGLNLFFDRVLNLFFKILSFTPYAHYTDWFLIPGKEAHVLRLLVALAPLLVSILLYNRLKGRRLDLDVLMNFSLLNALVMLLATRNWIFARFTPYFELFNLVLIPHFLTIRDTGFRRFLLLMIVGLYLVLMLLLLPRESNLVPYQTIFDAVL